MKIINTLFIAALAFLCISQESTAMIGDEEQDGHSFRVVCQNVDIGPVKDGHFMRDQKYLVEDGGIQGKRPGSGLFNIPQGKTRTNEDCFALFNMFPIVTVMLKDGSVERSSIASQLNLETAEKRHPHALGLPGDSIEIVLPKIYPFDISAIMVQLFTWQHGYTTSGGQVWIRNKMKPTAISQLVALMPDEKARTTMYENNKLFANFSWPSTGPYQEDTKIDPDVIQVTLNHFERHNNVSREQLDPNWKTTLGMHTDLKDPAGWWCYQTRTFNRKNQGADKSEDILSLGKDFPYYAGHPLEVSLWEARK